MEVKSSAGRHSQSSVCSIEEPMTAQAVYTADTDICEPLLSKTLLDIARSGLHNTLTRQNHPNTSSKVRTCRVDRQHGRIVKL